MENYIVLALLIIIVGSSIFYIIKEKKKGRKCLGCPYSGCEKCNCDNDNSCDK